jgi:3-dehydro-L-gulonate 2-dehydrogenase
MNNEGKTLQYNGGYNKEGMLTTFPGEILESWRVLPAGYWKGAGLSLLLDILATILSGGRSTHQIMGCSSEYSVSQVFIATDIKKLHNFPAIENSIRQIIEDLHKSIPIDASVKIRYPGENIPSLRKENLKNGISVNTVAWENLIKL